MKVISCGTNTQRIITAISPNTNGYTAFAACAMEIFAMPHHIKSKTPTGGVTAPTNSIIMMQSAN